MLLLIGYREVRRGSKAKAHFSQIEIACLRLIQNQRVPLEKRVGVKEA